MMRAQDLVVVRIIIIHYRIIVNGSPMVAC
jgi:hypothetical protein